MGVYPGAFDKQRLLEPAGGFASEERDSNTRVSVCAPSVVCLSKFAISFLERVSLTRQPRWVLVSRVVGTRQPDRR